MTTIRHADLVDSVAAASPDTEHLDDCLLGLRLDEFKCHVSLLCRWLLDRVAATLRRFLELGGLPLDPSAAAPQASR